MVSPTFCTPSEAAGGSRRYSRACPPYSLTYPERRFYLSSSSSSSSSYDNRAMNMADREDSDPPRKRIAVACGRCRKRKIRCSGDPGNGGPCSNCKNANHEPCLFLRVSSQETPFMKDSSGDYTYNLDAARPYAHQTRGPVSPLSSLTQYAAATHDMTGGGAETSYRQSAAYPSYSSKGYYPAMAGWTTTAATTAGAAYGATDDVSGAGAGGADYGLSYAPYQMVTAEPAPIIPSSYHQYTNVGRGKSVYMDTDVQVQAATPFSYGSLVHRPATVSGDGAQGGFSLSSMAASLPSSGASDRILASDRLHSSVSRTLTSSSGNYRGDAAHLYSNSSSAGPSSKTTAGMSDVTAYGASMHPSYESAYNTAVSSRGLSATTAETSSSSTYDQLYASSADHQTMRAGEDVGYVYGSDASKLGLRRESSQSQQNNSPSSHGATTAASAGGTGSLLSNGQLYVPESHSHPAHGYMMPGTGKAQARGGADGHSGVWAAVLKSTHEDG
ncbi:hypothetical protein F5Y17DRAFT_54394 [Xylariaceae sp. FL0594]|nr:hypothetical protein F5Y17DRAFT_54394 [Xylariaceae sp. FL0594]